MAKLTRSTDLTSTSWDVLLLRILIMSSSLKLASPSISAMPQCEIIKKTQNKQIKLNEFCYWLEWFNFFVGFEGNLDHRLNVIDEIWVQILEITKRRYFFMIISTDFSEKVTKTQRNEVTLWNICVTSTITASNLSIHICIL